MTYETNARPPITSYDSDYEHSLERWLETRRLVLEAEEDSERPVQTEFSDIAKAS